MKAARGFLVNRRLDIFSFSTVRPLSLVVRQYLIVKGKLEKTGKQIHTFNNFCFYHGRSKRHRRLLSLRSQINPTGQKRVISSTKPFEIEGIG